MFIGILTLGTTGFARSSPGFSSEPALAAPARPHIDVIEVSGRVDPVVVDFVRTSLRKAETGGALALVLQIDSPGSVVEQRQLDALAFRLGHSRVPVTAWVGPSGAHAYGGAMALVRAADIAAAAPGSRLGRATPPVFGTDPLERKTVEAEEARRMGAIELTSPTLGEFIVDLNGRRVGDVLLETAKPVPTSSGPRLQPTVEMRFAKPPLLGRLLHTVASPPVAFLLLVVGLLLLVFEFFTVGIGIAAACGVGALVLSAYGLGVLPTRPLGVALVALGILGYAIDVQAGAPRAWTAIGTVALVLGALNFYRGLSVGALPFVVAVLGTAAFMIGGMAGVVRSRFSTPTIGRESMIGERATAVGAINPEGMVRLRGGLWRARTNRATPIAGGNEVRVVAIDGLLLEVEPLQGAARTPRH